MLDTALGDGHMAPLQAPCLAGSWQAPGSLQPALRDGVLGRWEKVHCWWSRGSGGPLQLIFCVWEDAGWCVGPGGCRGPVQPLSRGAASWSTGCHRTGLQVLCYLG